MHEMFEHHTVEPRMREMAEREMREREEQLRRGGEGRVPQAPQAGVAPAPPRMPEFRMDDEKTAANVGAVKAENTATNAT